MHKKQLFPNFIKHISVSHHRLHSFSLLIYKISNSPVGFDCEDVAWLGSMLCEGEDVAIGVVGVVGIVVVPVVSPVSAFGRITRKTTAATAPNRSSIPRTHPRMDHIFADLMFLFWSVHCKTQLNYEYITTVFTFRIVHVQYWKMFCKSFKIPDS